MHLLKTKALNPTSRNLFKSVAMTGLSPLGLSKETVNGYCAPQHSPGAPNGVTQSEAFYILYFIRCYLFADYL